MRAARVARRHLRVRRCGGWAGADALADADADADADAGTDADEVRGDDGSSLRGCACPPPRRTRAVALGAAVLTPVANPTAASLPDRPSIGLVWWGSYGSDRVVHVPPGSQFAT
ncbi:hypothetical protein ACWD3I_08585 [Streptomyces sp. NPDC002817]|uniref:hypothetical protein n=1 Tax=Streptomyces sp. NPDC088357 TaxID=3154655 RepID=UPI00341C4FE9